MATSPRQQVAKLEKPMPSPWDGQKITSPATQLVKGASDPFVFWSNQLREIGPGLDAADAVQHWSLLSAIYALTEEENVKLRATDAYAFAGGSATTGKRKFVALVKAGLVLTAKNPGRRNEKYVSISESARRAVLRTLDEWARLFETHSAAYRKYRSASHGGSAHP
jgi:hypothetical protein